MDAPTWLEASRDTTPFAVVTPTAAVGLPTQRSRLDLLEALDHLEELNLTDTPITDAGLAYVERLINMRSLFLDNINQAASISS